MFSKQSQNDAPFANLCHSLSANHCTPKKKQDQKENIKWHLKKNWYLKVWHGLSVFAFSCSVVGFLFLFFYISLFFSFSYCGVILLQLYEETKLFPIFRKPEEPWVPLPLLIPLRIWLFGHHCRDSRFCIFTAHDNYTNLWNSLNYANFSCSEFVGFFPSVCVVGSSYWQVTRPMCICLFGKWGTGCPLGTTVPFPLSLNTWSQFHFLTLNEWCQSKMKVIAYYSRINVFYFGKINISWLLLS